MWRACGQNPPRRLGKGRPSWRRHPACRAATPGSAGELRSPKPGEGRLLRRRTAGRPSLRNCTKPWRSRTSDQAILGQISTELENKTTYGRFLSQPIRAVCLDAALWRWHSPELDDAYYQGIKAAISDCGYERVCLKWVQPGDLRAQLADRIIAGLGEARTEYLWSLPTRGCGPSVRGWRTIFVWVRSGWPPLTHTATPPPDPAAPPYTPAKSQKTTPR